MPRREQVSRTMITTDILLAIIDKESEKIFHVTETLAGEQTDRKKIEKYAKKYYDTNDSRFLKVEKIEVNPPTKIWMSMRDFLTYAHRNNIDMI